jgi:hypothetical protein
MIPLILQNHGGGLSCWIGVTIRNNPYYYDMFEAKNHFRLDYTSTLYIHIYCLFTFQCSEWSYGCNLTSSKPWRWTELAESDSQLGTKHTTTTMTWLLPRTTSDWITLPSYIYIKCLSTLQWSGWSYVCILTSSEPWRWVEPGWIWVTNG